MANIIHEAFIYQGRTLAEQTQHGPRLTYSDLPMLNLGTGYRWCIVCQCWVHDWRESEEAPLTVNEQLVAQLAATILVLERDGH